MGVASKGKRRIEYNETVFYWWVGLNEEDCGKAGLTIVSRDKKYILYYRIGEGDHCVSSSGRVFQGKKSSGVTEIYVGPIKEPPLIVTPYFVKK